MHNFSVKVQENKHNIGISEEIDGVLAEIYRYGAY